MIVTCYNKVGYMYNIDILWQTACMIFNLIMVDNFASFFNCMSSD